MFLELSAQSLGLYTVVNFFERMIPTVKPEQNVGKGGGGEKLDFSWLV